MLNLTTATYGRHSAHTQVQAQPQGWRITQGRRDAWSWTQMLGTGSRIQQGTQITHSLACMQGLEKY